MQKKIEAWQIWWANDSQIKNYKNPKPQRPVVVIKTTTDNCKILSITSNEDNKWFYYPLEISVTKNNLVSNVQMNESYKLKKEFFFNFVRDCTESEVQGIQNWHIINRSQNVAFYLLALEELKEVKQNLANASYSTMTQKIIEYISRDDFDKVLDGKTTPLNYYLKLFTKSTNFNQSAAGAILNNSYGFDNNSQKENLDFKKWKEVYNYILLTERKNYLTQYVRGAKKTIFFAILNNDVSSEATAFKNLSNLLNPDKIFEDFHTNNNYIEAEWLKKLCLSLKDNEDAKPDFFWNLKAEFIYQTQSFFPKLKKTEGEAMQYLSDSNIQKITTSFSSYVFRNVKDALSEEENNKQNIQDVFIDISNVSDINIFLSLPSIQNNKSIQTFLITSICGFFEVLKLKQTKELEVWINKNNYKNYDTPNINDMKLFPKNPSLINNYLEKTKEYGVDRLIKQHIKYFIKEKIWEK